MNCRRGILNLFSIITLFLLSACVAPAKNNQKVVQAFADALQSSPEMASLLPTPSPSPISTPSPTPTSTPSPTATPLASPSPILPSNAAFGFNAPWMYGVTHGPASSISELSEAVKYLNMPIVRFPGGSVSREYHFNLPGYDGKQAGETENYIIPFSKIFAPAGSAPLARIAFLPNIDEHFRHINYHGSDEDLIAENLQTLNYLLDKNFKIETVELGNEEYLTPELFWSFGTNPWKPIDTVDQNIQALVEIKLTYAIDAAYQYQHFQQGIDHYISLMNTYKTRINLEMDRRGLPHPKYGISIPWIYSMTYSDVNAFNTYYLNRIRDLRGVDALIPHYYKDFNTGNGNNVIVDMKRTLAEVIKFFCLGNTATDLNCPTAANNPNAKVLDQRKIWVTEFSSRELNSTNQPQYDTPEQLSVISQMAQVFKDPLYKTEYFMLHQYFTDGAGEGMIYKNSSTTYHPVNGIIANGVMTPNQTYGKSLFYSPRYCWAVKERGASTAEYNTVKANYGCP